MMVSESMMMVVDMSSNLIVMEIFLCLGDKCTMVSNSVVLSSIVIGVL